jgi:hypothetical protein
MKKLLLSLACGLIMTASAHAELPDMTKVWQSIGTGRIEQAKKTVDEMYSNHVSEQQHQRLERGESSQWSKAHSEESSRDVEEWLHFHLIKLYIAQKENNSEEVNLHMTNIKQLAYLEFMGKTLVE